MPKQIIIAEKYQVAAVFGEDQIQELVVATGNQQVSDIYLGVVENVIPGIDAAFVNIGDSERNGFIHVSDLGPVRLKRAAGAITELLSPQQKVLVQVMKEPTGNKGPRLTGNISLPGRFLVLIPNGKGVNLSRRIRSEDERSRLRALAILIKPAGMGLLVRTEAEGKAEDAIIEDLDYLQKQWEVIQQQATTHRAPCLLNRDDDFIQRVLRDIYSADVNRIVVDTPAAVKRVKQHLMNWSGGRAPEGVVIDHHREPSSILDYFRVNAAIREALKPRVDLPSGGYIVIEPTEALTVIDVNSGSFTRSATARETVLWTNCEAADEIARQLRLRNIGGVIIIDFIDMDSRRDQLKVLEQFNKAIRADKARPQIAQLSELGLVELTRKRQGKNLYELFGQPCSTCGGTGHLVHLPGETQAIAAESTVIPSLPTISPLGAPILRLPDKLSDDFTPVLDLDPGNESEDPDSEIDLLFHPSYQEQGGVNPGNRRRRRRRGNEPFVKEENGSKPVVTIAKKEPIVEEEPTVVEERRDRSPRQVRREEVPIEHVSVEMTELEQEIYAVMGISPLVRLDREFKDPKSVITSIRLPSDPPLTEHNEQLVIPHDLPPTDAKVAEAIPAPTKEPEPISPEPRTPETLSEPPRVIKSLTPVVVNPVEPPVPVVASIVKAKIDSNEVEKGIETGIFEAERPIIRRRRRRSSAQES
jgi:ribonuclease E